MMMEFSDKKAVVYYVWENADDVKEFLKKAILTSREQKISPAALSLFLQKYGIAIKGVVLNQDRLDMPFLNVQFLNESDEIEEAFFNLQEVDGRPLDEIKAELDARMDMIHNEKKVN